MIGLFFLLAMVKPSYQTNTTNTIGSFFLAPYAASSSGKHPPSLDTGMAVFFWGNPPSTWLEYYEARPDDYTAAKLLPGSYSHKILNLGGGGTAWSDAEIDSAIKFIPIIKTKLGFDGVCFDCEVMFASQFKMSNFLRMFEVAKNYSMLTVLTSTAEGPYLGCDSPADCWKDIKWDNIDYMVPQMYGPSGSNYPPKEFNQYANFWKNGGGQGIHSFFHGPKDLNKILWATTSGTGASSLRELGFGGGFMEWAYRY